VAGLVLVATPGKTSAEEAQKIMASLDADYPKVMASYWETLVKDARPEVRSMLETDMRRLQREPAKAMIAATFAYDPLPALSGYTGPLLLIDIERGDTGPNALYRQLRKTPRDVVSGTSHWPQLDDPERFNGLLDAFLLHVR
jgi:pimeloyl-ACP methyl ester carboxylesterase